MSSTTNGNAVIPVHRVYEMRGTLFHEVQAHKLALNDLGKAIAINPSHAGNYFLRGDCNYKLGNYEQVSIRQKSLYCCIVNNYMV